jgi:hypothetical protein
MNKAFTSEYEALYELIFSDHDPTENHLMTLCQSFNPLNEIGLYRQSVKRRYQEDDSLNGILARAFRKSIALVTSLKAHEILQGFVQSTQFRNVRDIPGYSDEQPLSESFHEYLLWLGPKANTAFREALVCDFFQGLMIEAYLSPHSPWIPRYSSLHRNPNGDIHVRFSNNSDLYIMAITEKKIVKYRIIR